MIPSIISVIICTHNSRQDLLAHTLESLRGQTLSLSQWELLIVDNASIPPVVPGLAAAWHPSSRIVPEARLGLTPARLRGIAEARSPLLVFVDDDNVLAPDYLALAVHLFTGHPHLGAAGGAVLPEWEAPPPAWMLEFQGLLALRDLGPASLVCAGGPGAQWPHFAPVGAGLVVRRSAALRYAEAVAGDPMRQTFDRAGLSLTSGGDNDLVFTVLHEGGDVAYFPELRLTHLIPRVRLTPDYLAALNAGIMRTWVRVLALHGQCPWPPIPRWTVPLRKIKAWFSYRAWSGPAARVRWRGACGQFEGRVPF